MSEHAVGYISNCREPLRNIRLLTCYDNFIDKSLRY
jgi:hypothetical protein